MARATASACLLAPAPSRLLRTPRPRTGRPPSLRCGRAAEVPERRRPPPARPRRASPDVGRAAPGGAPPAARQARTATPAGPCRRGPKWRLRGPRTPRPPAARRGPRCDRRAHASTTPRAPRPARGHPPPAPRPGPTRSDRRPRLPAPGLGGPPANRPSWCRSTRRGRRARSAPCSLRLPMAASAVPPGPPWVLSLLAHWPRGRVARRRRSHLPARGSRWPPATGGWP